MGLKPDLIIGDSLKILSKIDEDFDIVYIDPPYESGIYQDVIKLINSGLIIAEHSKHIEFDNIKLVKQKNYGGKFVSFLEKNC